MIVFIDSKNYLVKVYTDEGLKSFGFHDTTRIYEAIGNNSFLYVTNAMLANRSDLMQLLVSMPIPPGATSRQQPVVVPTAQKNDMEVLRSTGSRMIIQDLSLEFKGPASFYSVSALKKRYGDDILMESEPIRNMMKLGKLEIVPLWLAEEDASASAERQKNRERNTSSIIVDDSNHERHMDNYDNAGTAADPLDIELGRGGTRKFGGSSQSTPNESRMPDSFPLF